MLNFKKMNSIGVYLQVILSKGDCQVKCITFDFRIPVADFTSIFVVSEWVSSSLLSLFLFGCQNKAFSFAYCGSRVLYPFIFSHPQLDLGIHIHLIPHHRPVPYMPSSHFLYNSLIRRYSTFRSTSSFGNAPCFVTF